MPQPCQRYKYPKYLDFLRECLLREFDVTVVVVVGEMDSLQLRRKIQPRSGCSKLSCASYESLEQRHRIFPATQTHSLPPIRHFSTCCRAIPWSAASFASLSARQCLCGSAQAFATSVMASTTSATTIVSCGRKFFMSLATSHSSFTPSFISLLIFLEASLMFSAFFLFAQQWPG